VTAEPARGTRRRTPGWLITLVLVQAVPLLLLAAGLAAFAAGMSRGSPATALFLIVPLAVVIASGWGARYLCLRGRTVAAVPVALLPALPLAWFLSVMVVG